MKKAFLYSLFLLASVAFSGSALAADSGPMSAVAAAQKAIDASDPDMFRQAVDMDSVLGKGMDAALAVLQEEMANGRLAGQNAMLALALSGLSGNEGQKAMLKQVLATEAKNFVVMGISGGYFAGKPNGKVRTEDGSVFSALFANASMARKELIPGKVLSNKDGIAAVSAVLADGDAGRFPLELGLVRADGRWRVTELRNAQALLKQAASGGR